MFTVVRRQNILRKSIRRASSSYSKEELTHFGFQTISEVEKKEKVIDVFRSVSTKYDLMNDLMSAGIHRVWKSTFVNNLNPSPEHRILDVAGGTGDIAFRILDHLKATNKDSNGGKITVCDINGSMLDVGRSRASAGGYLAPQIEFVEGDAQALQFPDNSFDAYTIAFGIRNVVRIEEAISEAYRVLKPGGRFMCLEFAPVDTPVIGDLYNAYLFNVIPPLGEVVSGDWNSYQYLVESIQNFPPQDDFKQIIQDAGFRFVTYKNLSLGIVAIHSGFKIPQ
uniref:2-methoxy-6-polyprenyl-1,4-benzoquinol methylase, mitochondrial n=1 Tax=Caligus clemensi TaxID=344056 RepID=C1C238_CALCM|nr:Ubiquinone biosynthesis methyltransferase COQ5, mitochondrial precursor [Caligus clemensi]